MRPISVRQFQRFPLSESAYIEDGVFFNPITGCGGVSDGNSAAFCPGKPPLLYSRVMTGGQMATGQISLTIAEEVSSSIEEILALANKKVLDKHRAMNKNPLKDDVGGASFALFQIQSQGIYFVYGGDCFILVETGKGHHFLMGFDESAFEEEENNNKAYEKCLREADGDKGKAWNLHWAYYTAKRLRCSNKNIRRGGYATVNGDPELIHCCKRTTFWWSNDIKRVILGTDGLLPAPKADTDYSTWFDVMARKLCKLHLQGGIDAIVKWRDSVEAKRKGLSHIHGWPEATAMELIF